MESVNDDVGNLENIVGKYLILLRTFKKIKFYHILSFSADGFDSTIDENTNDINTVEANLDSLATDLSELEVKHQFDIGTFKFIRKIRNK